MLCYDSSGMLICFTASLRNNSNRNIEEHVLLSTSAAVESYTAETELHHYWFPFPFVSVSGDILLPARAAFRFDQLVECNCFWKNE